MRLPRPPVLLALGIVAVANACGGSPGPPLPAVAGPNGGTADVLQVSCSDGVLTLGADRVEVDADGLHVEVEALPDDGTSVEFRSPDEPELEVGSGGAAHTTGRTVIDTVAPGPLLVRCHPEDGPRHFLGITEDEEARAVEVVDSGGYWVPPDPLDCTGPVARMIPDYATPPAPPVEPAEPLADAVDTTGRDGAEVRTHGYPGGRLRWASIVVDGDVVSRGTYERDGASWRVVGSTSCG